MFSSIAPSAGQSSRRRATLCSAALHAAAIAALWATGQAITAPPPMPQHKPREAVLVVTPPPRLFRPRPRLRTAVQRFEIERAAVTRTPEAVRPEPQAPKVAARPDPAPILPEEPAVEVRSPAHKPAGFAEVSGAVAPKLAAEPSAAAFGAARGRPEAPSAVPPGGAAGFGAIGLAQAKTSIAAARDGGFGGVEIGRAERRTAMAGEAGFGTAERGPAAVTAGEPTPGRRQSRPVKILWKPAPKYSEEGVRRRIEGDVVLLVRFLAQGTVETLKVIQGLGYGLDEQALQAAQAIRFEPAAEGGRAIDYTAQVRIRFELAY